MSSNDNAESSNLGGGESLTKVVNDNSPIKVGDIEATTLNETESKKVARRGRKPVRANVRNSAISLRYVCKERNRARILRKVIAYCLERKFYRKQFSNGTEEDMEDDEVLKNEPIMEDFLPTKETPPSPSLKNTEAAMEDAALEGSNPTRKRKNTSSG